MTEFLLDPLLAADTVPIGDWSLSRVLLMNDSRFPWVVLVPRCGGCVELFDLTPDHQQALISEVTRASRVIRTLFKSEKINVASLGNIVSQLHVHIVGRKTDDVAWPGPVWGFGKAQRFSPAEIRTLLDRLAIDLAITPISS